MRPIAAAAILLAALPAAAQDAPRKGGAFTIALNADIRSLEPGINRDGNTDTVVHTIFEGLVAYRADLSVGPALAESWTVADDGRTYRFTLRDGVRFHNGQPLTASALKWTWDRQWAHQRWGCKRFFDGTTGLKVEAMETPDDRTVVYRLAQPSGLFLKQLANLQCGLVAAHPDSADAEGKWTSPIGTGPLKLADWRRGEFVALDRFDGYSPSAAPGSAYAGARIMHFDRVVFRVVPDASSAEAGLATGDLDLLPEVEAHRVAALKQRGVTVLSSPGLSWAVLLMQTRDPLLADVRIRRAIAHAIDLDQMADARGEGLVQAHPSPVDAGSSYFDERFKAWPAHDPARARALLKEAGYKGQPLKIQTNKRSSANYDNAVVAQAMLAAAGFTVELEVLDWATQLDNYLKGNFQIQSFGYSARFDPGLRFASLIADKDKSKWAQWDDPKAIQLLQESTRTADEARRKAIFAELHQMMADQVPTIGLYYDPGVEAVGARVRGYKTWPASRPIPWGVWKVQ